jgi:hypothetical protein
MSSVGAARPRHSDVIRISTAGRGEQKAFVFDEIFDLAKQRLIECTVVLTQTELRRRLFLNSAYLAGNCPASRELPGGMRDSKSFARRIR